MIKSEQKIPQPELLRELQVLMLLRVLFISLLLGALIFIQIRATRTYFGDIHTSHYLILAGVYFISIVYVFLLKRSRNIVLQAYLQLLVDSFIVTALLYTTGGIESIFSFLYILNIFSGSILLYRSGGMIVASSSSILYGLLLDLHYYGVIHPLASRLSYPERYQSAYLFFTILANMAGFYLVGYLSSFLSEQARKSRAELRVKEDNLSRLEVLNESIIASITSGLIVLDEQERIILFNPTAEKMFGLKANQVYGHLIGDTLPLLAEHLTGRSFISIGLPEIQAQFTDFAYTRPDGKQRHLQLSISPLQYSLGEQKGRILSLQDMTKMKQIEEELKEIEGLALIGELAAGIAHEIRNPMASISGSIEMLRDEIEQNDVNTRLMEIILRETDRLNGLVADFLLFARAQRPKLTELDLNQLILESLELFKNSQGCHRDTKIFTNLEDPLIVTSDSGQLKQVLWNLFLNASEAMRNGGSLRVTTSLENGSPEKRPGKARIIIRDTGEGFNEENLSRVFLPFFTTKERGSGLGLAIVKRIVDRLEGKVLVGNHPEGGAEITIVLPVRPTLMRG
ncbi:MAG: PAS domain S-box protein [Deltaproteobacteria bacterium]|nr:PAS domain S-box protein [Deltaproteobacteria bacterium]